MYTILMLIFVVGVVLPRSGMAKYRRSTVSSKRAVWQGGDTGLLYLLLHKLHAYPTGFASAGEKAPRQR